MEQQIMTGNCCWMKMALSSSWKSLEMVLKWR